MKFIETSKLRTAIFVLFLVVSIAFSQEAAKFQIPLDSSGAPAPAVIAPKPDTVQKLGLASGLPLNLNALSAKDTDDFDVYSQRLALINDSISANYRAMEAAKKSTEASMPAFEPKGEFEKQSEFDSRREKWQTEFAQRLERDTRSYSSRKEQLEKAKIKVLENQASLYGSVDIKTSPSAVSIWIGREEIGASPALYKLLIPGATKITFKKDGYNQYDTTLQVSPGAKFKIDVELEEKSIFSEENEINFVKILNKDTNMQGYEARIKTIEARKVQIDKEIQDILMNFSNVYPPLEVQRPGESQEAFKKRHDIWTKEGMRQYGELQKKHEVYKAKLDRSIAVLGDYIVAVRSSIISEPAAEAKLELGAYDADKEVFELVAQDTANKKSPFLFSGKVAVPRDVAMNVNRASPGFAAGVQFINYPFEKDSISVNLAMSQLVLSNGGQELKVEGSFGEIEKYKALEGYGVWKIYADSLLQGTLKPQGLDYNYAMGKDAAKSAKKDDGSSSGLGWRGWTRIAAFTMAAGFTGAAIVKHYDADKRLKDIDKLKANPPAPTASDARKNSWKNSYNAYKDLVETRELHRNIFAGAAGVCAVGGIATFFF